MTKPRTYAQAAVTGKIESSGSDMETEEGYTTVARRQRTKRTNAGGPRTPSAPGHRQDKPPAVLIKTKPGSTYAQTVAAVKAAVNPAELGAPVRRIRRTQDGHTIVEFDRTAAAHEAAGKMRAALTQKAAETVEAVSQLGNVVVAEIVDIDPTATEEDVVAAIRSAADECSTEATDELAATAVTGLWHVKSGTQVATVNIPKTLLGKLDRLHVGWTVARIRPRAPEPLKCFRCHGYGHTKFACRGPDLELACRSCGESGHREVDCNAKGDRCVACERGGFQFTKHKTGSAGCAARRQAQVELRTGTRGNRDRSARRDGARAPTKDNRHKTSLEDRMCTACDKTGRRYPPHKAGSALCLPWISKNNADAGGTTDKEW